MYIGGVLLAPGMVLGLQPDDYLDGTERIELLVQRILSTDGDKWIVLAGLQRPDAHYGWRPRRVKVRVRALKRSMSAIFTP